MSGLFLVVLPVVEVGRTRLVNVMIQRLSMGVPHAQETQHGVLSVDVRVYDFKQFREYS